MTDWSNRTVLPGLIDLHTHVADGFGQSDDPAEPATPLISPNAGT